MALILPKASDIDTGKLHRVPETEHSGTILAAHKELDESRLVGRAKAGRRRRRRTTKGTQIDLTIESESAWAYNIRADLILEHVLDSLLAHHHANIVLGVKADGSGPQAPTKDGSSRGYDTGFFADTLYRSKISGSTATANATIAPNRLRGAWLTQEYGLGNEFLYVTGEAEVVITAALQQVLDASLNGSVKPQPDSGVQLAANA